MLNYNMNQFLATSSGKRPHFKVPLAQSCFPSLSEVRKSIYELEVVLREIHSEHVRKISKRMADENWTLNQLKRPKFRPESEILTAVKEIGKPLY